MPYAIGHVVVGLYIDPLRNRKQHDLAEYMNDSDIGDALGMESYYCSSGGGGPLVCGIELFKFDECSYVDPEKLRKALTPGGDTLEKAEKKIAKFKDRFRKVMAEDREEVGENAADLPTVDEVEKWLRTIPDKPGVHIVFSSS